jgi:7,8-dihydroneopterin aldolase/epimerase/oxygenase
MADRIIIKRLELLAHIGVPEEERAHRQRLTASLVLEPLRDFRALNDRLENTVDYYYVAECVRIFSAMRPRRLIETLAEEIAAELLARFPLRSVEIELRKYILPDAAYVAVQLRRERPDSPTHA